MNLAPEAFAAQRPPTGGSQLRESIAPYLSKVPHGKMPGASNS